MRTTKTRAALTTSALLFSFLASPSSSASADEAPWTWPESSVSPRPLPPRDVTTDLASIYAHCGVPDAALTRVAERVVARKLAAGKGPSESEIEAELRAAGEPHVWPRSWMVSGAESTLTDAAILPKLDAWRSSWRTFGQVRCGIARGKSSPAPSASASASASAAAASGTLAVVAVDALADLAPVPIRTHAGTWLAIEADLGVASTGADIIVARDGGAPLHLFTAFDGARARARFAPDRPGVFSVQVLAHLPEGPRPVLEARVYADVDLPASPDETSAAPGEYAATAAAPADALVQMIHALRSDGSLPPLTRDPALDRLAEAHARLMLARVTAAHDLGDGDPEARVRQAGIDVRAIGENVAHAASARQAHRALYESPSHRANLLRKDFRNVGVAVVVGPDGSVWVAELFTS